MGVQPATLQSGLVAATASTDTTRPDLDDHRAGRRRDGARRQPGHDHRHGQRHRRRRRRRRRGVDRRRGDLAPGDRAASVELHLDADGAGPVTIRSRATDDSAQHRDARAGRDGHGAAAAPASCPCTIWPSTATPGGRPDPDTDADRARGEVPPDVAGSITGVRFYKGAGNTGTHVGNLWTGDRHAAGHGHLHQRDGVAAGSRPTSPRRSRSPPTRPTSPPTTRRSAATRSDGGYFTDRPSTTRRCTRWPTARAAATASTATAHGRRFPTSAYQRELLGRRGVHPRAADTHHADGHDRTPAAGATGVATRHDGDRDVQRAGAAGDDRRSSCATGQRHRSPATVGLRRGDPYGDVHARARRWPRRPPTPPRSAGPTDTAGNTMEPVTGRSRTAAAADTTPPTVTGRDPGGGATGVASATAVTATFSEAVQPRHHRVAR